MQSFFNNDDSNGEKFDARKFHGDAAELYNVNDYDDEEFDVMKFLRFSNNYESVCDYYHYSDKCREAAHSICNFNIQDTKRKSGSFLQ